ALARAAIAGVVRAADAVVALGGGAIAQPDAARRLSARGTIVYLRAKPATLAKRIGAAAGRPGLARARGAARPRPPRAGPARAGRRRRITQLLAERVAHYETAQIAIDTDGLDPERV